jgi:hypothetical protein
VPAATIEELVVANRILNDRGVLDAYGHVSVRHPTNPNHYLMARAIAPGLVTAEDWYDAAPGPLRPNISCPSSTTVGASQLG